MRIVEHVTINTFEIFGITKAGQMMSLEWNSRAVLYRTNDTNRKLAQAT